MPRSAGTMVIPNTFTPGTTISSAQVNANFADIAAELTNSLPRDGQAAMLGPLPMGANYAESSGMLAPSAPSAGKGREYWRTEAGISRPYVKLSDGLEYARLSHFVTPQDFGAWGDNTHDDAAAIHAWFAAIRTRGLRGYIPPATYRCGSSIAWDFNDGGAVPFHNNMEIFGAGIERAKFVVDAGFNFNIFNSSAALATFYKKIGGFSVQTDISGIGLYIGANVAAGALNTCQFFDIHSRNISGGVGNVATQLQQLYSCDVDNLVSTSNSASHTVGTAIAIHQVNFSRLRINPGSSLVGSLLVGDGQACAGNAFIGCDYEELGTCIWLNDSAVRNNTWYGGVITVQTVSDIGIRAPGGVSNKFDNMAFGGPGTLFHATDRTGVLWVNAAGPGISTPSVPASGTPVTNDTNQRVTVSVHGGAYTQIIISGSTIQQSSGDNISTVVLMPGDTITLTYTVAPSWLWRVSY